MTGCNHPLAIKNLRQYNNTSLASFEKAARIGIKSSNYDIEGRNLTKNIAEGLSKYNAQVTTAVRPDNSNVDVIATISINSEHKGSGWNFLVNFPGFLIWAPAWHGYNYEVSHTVTVLLSDAKTGTKIDSFAIPVVLDIKHAAINRTWTEISWLEVGVIALIGGIVFIQYDDNVTPLVGEKAGPVLGDYIAQEIVNKLNGRL
jgi:hypothetical protein